MLTLNRSEFRYACVRGMLPEVQQLLEEKEKVTSFLEMGLFSASSNGQLKVGRANCSLSLSLIFLISFEIQYLSPSSSGDCFACNWLHQRYRPLKFQTVELLIMEGARKLSENVSHAAMNGHLLTASYIMMCAHCLALESSAVQNLTLEGRMMEHGVDVDGAFSGNCILADEPTELFFDKSFDLKVPIKLILEGKG